MGLEKEGNNVGIHNCGRCGIHQNVTDREPSLRSARIKATNFFRAFRIMLDIGLQVFYADRRFEDYARWESYMIPFRFRFVCLL